MFVVLSGSIEVARCLLSFLPEDEDDRFAGIEGMEQQKMTSNANNAAVVGRFCKLQRPVRDHDGRSRFSERPRILREMNNLDRRMYLVQFDDGATTFLFPDEVVVA